MRSGQRYVVDMFFRKPRSRSRDIDRLQRQDIRRDQPHCQTTFSGLLFCPFRRIPTMRKGRVVTGKGREGSVRPCRSASFSLLIRACVKPSIGWGCITQFTNKPQRACFSQQYAGVGEECLVCRYRLGRYAKGSVLLPQALPYPERRGRMGRIGRKRLGILIQC